MANETKMKSTQNGKDYRIDYLAGIIAGGAELDRRIPSDVAAAARKMSKTAAPRKVANKNDVSLYGRLVRETDKAILFKIAENVPQNTGAVGEAWWPKTQVTVTDDVLAGLAMLEAPRWLADKKIKTIN